MAASAQLGAAEVLADPSWVPYAFDDRYERLQFVRMDAAALRAAPFLDDRSLAPDTPRVILPVGEVVAGAPTTAAPPPAIFHSAFCCSTLFAKALDLPGTCLSLKEPNILMSLANAKRMLPGMGREGEFPRLFAAITELLGRPHASGERVLLKPTNTANNLLADWVGAGVPVLLMHASLEDFLVSVLKKGEECKSFVRTQYNIFALDGTGLSQIPQRRAMTFTDLQVAALVWRHQLEMFRQMRDARPTQVSTLQDTAFLADQGTHLTQAAKAFGLGHGEDAFAAAVSAGVMERDVKDGRALNADKRREEADNIRTQNKEALAQIGQWASALRLDGDVL